VWLPSSTQFALRIFGGQPTFFMDVCQQPDELYTYDVATRTLTRSGCIGSPGRFDSVVVSPVFAANLIGRLEPLKTVAGGPCGADQVDTEFGVSDGDAGTRVYHGDFYSGCQNGPTPPWIRTDDLLALRNFLMSAFDADAGSIPTDAGIDSCPALEPCNEACTEGRRNIVQVVNGCTVWICCAAVDD
jgi:hypothetical protein